MHECAGRKIETTTLLRSSERGTVELVIDRSGQRSIRRVIYDDMRDVYTALKDAASPWFPRVHSVELTDSTIVIEEELAGITLSRALVSRKIAPADARAAARDIMSAVAELERIHIVHRDIKPDNIMITTDGGRMTARIFDFSIAHEILPGTPDRRRLGTEGWAPPEQYGFAPTDTRSDIWSAGLVVKELCAAAGMPESSPLSRWAQKCSSFDPAARFQTAADALRALRSLGSRPKKFAAAILVAAITAAAIALRTPEPPSPELLLRGVGPAVGTAQGAVLTQDDRDAILRVEPRGERDAPFTAAMSLDGSVLSLTLEDSSGRSSFELRGSEPEDPSSQPCAELILYDLDGDGRRELVTSIWCGRTTKLLDGRELIDMENDIVRVLYRSDAGWRLADGEISSRACVFIIDRGGRTLLRIGYEEFSCWEFSSGALKRSFGQIVH